MFHHCGSTRAAGECPITPGEYLLVKMKKSASLNALGKIFYLDRIHTLLEKLHSQYNAQQKGSNWLISQLKTRSAIGEKRAWAALACIVLSIASNITEQSAKFKLNVGVCMDADRTCQCTYLFRRCVTLVENQWKQWKLTLKTGLLQYAMERNK